MVRAWGRPGVEGSVLDSCWRVGKEKVEGGDGTEIDCLFGFCMLTTYKVISAWTQTCDSICVCVGAFCIAVYLLDTHLRNGTVRRTAAMATPLALSSH